MPRAPREERPVTTSGPARSAVGAPATIGTPLEPHRTVPPGSALAAPGRESMILPPRAAAQPAPVHVHIGTVEVRTKASAAQALPPATTTVPSPAATAPTPARGYGWRFGLVQR
jgi:hypothetical protein